MPRTRVVLSTLVAAAALLVPTAVSRRTRAADPAAAHGPAQRVLHRHAGHEAADHAPADPGPPVHVGQRHQLDAQRRLRLRRLHGQRPARPRPPGALGQLRRSRSAPRWASTRSKRIVGLCGGAQGFTMRLIDPTTLEQIASLDMPSRDLTSGANPLSDLCGGTYFYLDRHNHAYVLTTGNQLWEVTIGASGARAHPHLRADDPRGRLHDRDHARLEGPDLLRHQGRPRRHHRPGDRRLEAAHLPRRGDLQLAGRRRDRRRLRGHRPPAADPGGRQDRDAAGALGSGVRPGHAAEARPALAGLGYDAHADRQGPRRDHRQRRAADERAVLQARRQRRGTGCSARHPSSRREPRPPRTAWSRRGTR